MYDRSQCVIDAMTAFKKRLFDEHKGCARKQGESLGHKKTLDTLRQFLIEQGVDAKEVFLKFPDGYICSNNEF